MAKVYINMEDLTYGKQQEIIEAYEEEGVDPGDLDEVFYCEFNVDDDGEVRYE